MQPNLSTLAEDMTPDAMVDGQTFRDGITAWASAFSVRYRQGSGTKPTLEDARRDLKLWSRSYWAREKLGGDSPARLAV